MRLDANSTFKRPVRPTHRDVIDAVVFCLFTEEELGVSRGPGRHRGELT